MVTHWTSSISPAKKRCGLESLSKSRGARTSTENCSVKLPMLALPPRAVGSSGAFDVRWSTTHMCTLTTCGTTRVCDPMGMRYLHMYMHMHARVHICKCSDPHSRTPNAYRRVQVHMIKGGACAGALCRSSRDVRHHGALLGREPPRIHLLRHMHTHTHTHTSRKLMHETMLEGANCCCRAAVHVPL